MSEERGVDVVQYDDDNINPHNGLGWQDNIQTFETARGAGTAEPTWSAVGNGNYAMKFTAGDELFVSYHVGHDYAPGTKAFPHIHFFSSDAEAADVTVVWRFSYVRAKGHAQGESLSDARVDIDITYTYRGDEVAGEHIITECSNDEAFELIEPDTMVIAGAKLLSTTAAGDIFGLMADLHYQVNRIATRRKAPNFYVR